MTIDSLLKALEMDDQHIGTTPGGKKIWAGKGAAHETYHNFSAADHTVAANLHAKRARDLNARAASMNGSLTLKRQAANSLHIATTHRQAATGSPTKLAASMRGRGHDMQALYLYADVLKKAGGEGSRGGHIVGHTRGGAPIYSHDMAASKKMAPMGDKPQNAALRAQHAKEHFGSYTAEDHKEARQEHLREGKRREQEYHRASQKAADGEHDGTLDDKKIAHLQEKADTAYELNSHHATMAAVHGEAAKAMASAKPKAKASGTQKERSAGASNSGEGRKPILAGHIAALMGR